MCLDPPPVELRERIVGDILSWLRRKQLIIPSEMPTAEREDFGLADWSPGPAWRRFTGGAHDLGALLNNGVTVTAQPEIQSALGNSEDPNCRRCGATFPLHETFEVMDDWLSGGAEPSIACHSCGWTDLVGEWDAEFPIALIGATTIVFHNWPPLPAEVVSALFTMLGGGRCRFFHQHL